MIVPYRPPPLPAPVREVVAGGAVSNAIDWIAAKFFEAVWAGAAFGAAIGVAVVLLAIAVGYLLGRVQR